MKCLTTHSVAFVLGAALLAGCATPTPGLDRRIAELNAEIASRRSTLTAQAQPYRAYPGHDVQADVSARPIMDILDAYNGLSKDEKIFALQSFDKAGSFFYAWTDCFWPFSGRIGYEVVPAFDDAFAAFLYLDWIDHHWGSDGLTFRLKNSFGAGGIILGGRYETCGLSATIPSGFAVVAEITHSAAGKLILEPKKNEGIHYRLETDPDQPLYMIAHGALFPVGPVSAPILWHGKLAEGTISNIVGQTGEVRISETGRVRKYQIDSDFRRAAYLPKGVSVSGVLVIKWLPPE